IGGSEDDAGPFQVAFAPKVLQSGETVTYAAAFKVPVNSEPLEYSATWTLHAEGVALGGEVATIALHGREAVGRCQMLQGLEFGEVGVGDVGLAGFRIRNPTLVPMDVELGAVTSILGGKAPFSYAPDSPRGKFTVPSEEAREITFEFRPAEPNDYLAFVNAK